MFFSLYFRRRGSLLGVEPCPLPYVSWASLGVLPCPSPKPFLHGVVSFFFKSSSFPAPALNPFPVILKKVGVLRLFTSCINQSGIVLALLGTRQAQQNEQHLAQ